MLNAMFSGGDGENPARGEEEQSTEEKDPSDASAAGAGGRSASVMGEGGVEGTQRRLSDGGAVAGVIRAVAPRGGKQSRPASYTTQPEHVCIPVTLERFDHPKRYSSFLLLSNCFEKSGPPTRWLSGLRLGWYVWALQVWQHVVHPAPHNAPQGAFDHCLRGDQASFLRSDAQYPITRTRY